MKVIQTALILLTFVCSMSHADINFVGNTVTLNGFSMEIRFSGKYDNHLALHGTDGGINTVVYMIAKNESAEDNPSYAASINMFEHLIKHASVGNTFNLKLICNSFPDFKYTGAPGMDQSIQFILHNSSINGCAMEWSREFPKESPYQ